MPPGSIPPSGGRVLGTRDWQRSEMGATLRGPARGAGRYRPVLGRQRRLAAPGRGATRWPSTSTSTAPLPRRSPRRCPRRELAPVLDVVFVTHEHGDHFGEGTARILAERLSVRLRHPSQLRQTRGAARPSRRASSSPAPRQPSQIAGIAVAPPARPARPHRLRPPPPCQPGRLWLRAHSGGAYRVPPRGHLPAPGPPGRPGPDRRPLRLPPPCTTCTWPTPAP